MITTKVLWLIILLPVAVLSKNDDSITGLWTFIELYSDEPENVNPFGNCLKLNITFTQGYCGCMDKELPIFNVNTMNFYTNISTDLALYFVNSYLDFTELIAALKNREMCKCEHFFIARMLNKNYFIVYLTFSITSLSPMPESSLPKIFLFGKDVPQTTEPIEELEAKYEEINNRTQAVLCSIITRQFYFN